MTKVLEDDLSIWKNIMTTPEEPQITVATPTSRVEEERSKQTTTSTMPSFRDDYETVKQHKVRKLKAYLYNLMI